MARTIGYATLRASDAPEHVIELFRNKSLAAHPHERLFCDFLFLDRIGRPFSSRPELQKLIDFVGSKDDVYIHRLTDLSFSVRGIHEALFRLASKGAFIAFVDPGSADLFQSFNQGVGFLRAAIRLDDLIQEERRQFDSVLAGRREYAKRGRPEKVTLADIQRLADQAGKPAIAELMDRYQISRSRAYEVRRSIDERRTNIKRHPELTSSRHEDLTPMLISHA